MKIKNYLAFAIFALFSIAHASGQIQGFNLLNSPLDISPDFRNFKNIYYLADSLKNFDPSTGKGRIVYTRHEWTTRQAFNNMLAGMDPVKANEFPGGEYEVSPALDFEVSFISDNTVRIRMKSGLEVEGQVESLMLEGGSVEENGNWEYSKEGNKHIYTSDGGSLILTEYPWHIEFRDADGKKLTRTFHKSDNAVTFTPVLPFCWVRRASDYSRSFAAVFDLHPDEKIFGFGESFTEFNKRGQKVVLWIDDANGTQNETMYKPVPFFMSNRGYGMFMHTSSPITVDVGKYYSGVNSLMIGDEELDLFVFLGEPKKILDEYTDVTGKAPMPPLWSFGFWMSRITYFSQEEGLEVAKKLRENEIPSDVLHFDTGWFEKDWRSDYKFAPSRFEDPEQMIDDLDEMGLKTSLWQLPYFVPKNDLFPEIIDKGLYIKNRKGNLPYEDAVLDFTNPATVSWYQDKIKGLLDLGVAVIKVDFGEAAPRNGIYANGRTGFYEHNLYPLRYNKTVAEITKEVSGENIIWARSTWAGSQRYPLHWGGDPANTDMAMAATLRGGLSIGLSGFSFWSHDIGGFVQKTPEELYRRWTPFGMLTGHVRSHGAPPTEPWEYGEDFADAFRKAANLRYRLMPYIYAQAKHCSENGLPMLRALFIEYPDDPGSWQVDNQYLLGSDILVAPLFEESNERDVYLPPGKWIDYQTEKIYEEGWHKIEAGEIPVVMLVKDGTVLPHIELAQSTKFMDWSKLELKVFSTSEEADGYVCLPDEMVLHEVELRKERRTFKLVDDPLDDRVKWRIVGL